MINDKSQDLNKLAIKYHKEFVRGNQNVIFDRCTGNTTNLRKTYYWEEQSVYNQLNYIILLESKSFYYDEDALYGIDGLVSHLVDLQLLYNKLKNRKIEYLYRCSVHNTVVEDGSVDTDCLEEDGLIPGKILVYRQRAAKPTFNYYTFQKDLDEAYERELSNIKTQIHTIIKTFEESHNV